ncbi:unnamed protein product [Dicrocoelium dendriticum]|nr:unnamed protein product [Dicrocoelium dendriticum]
MVASCGNISLGSEAEKTEGSVTTLSSDGSAVPTEPYPTATTMDETSLVLTDVPITPVARLRASTNVQSTGDATSLFIAPILLQLTEHSPDDITSIMSG